MRQAVDTSISCSRGHGTGERGHESTMISDGGFDPDDVVFLTRVLEDVSVEAKAQGYRNGSEAATEREHLAMIHHRPRVS